MKFSRNIGNLHTRKKTTVGYGAYFCHHLPDNNVDLSDLYVDLSVIYVDLSVIYVDLSDYMSTCQKNITATTG